MASAKNVETNVFVFTWKIENFVYYVNEKISSPGFFVHSIDSEFSLELSIGEQQPGESVISLYLDLVQSHSQFTELNFELSILALDGSRLFYKQEFDKLLEYGKFLGFFDFVSFNDIVKDRKNEFLPQDTLSLQCKIWKSGSNMSESVLCFARTRLGIEQSSFVWPIERFSALTTDRTVPYEVRVASQENPLLSMNFQFVDASFVGKQFEIELTPGNVHQITSEKGEDTTGGEVGLYDFKLSFINVSGDEKLILEKSRLEYHEIQSLPVLFKGHLLKEENGYLVGDVLSLKCQFTFYEGIISDQLENTVFGSGAMSIKSDPCTVALYHNDTSAPISSLEDIQKILYDTRLFCDVKLRSGNECFSAHKNILSAKSPVFQSMLLGKNIEENVVEVSDVDADSLRRMIHYIYTDTLDYKLLDNVYKLFEAAMKYEISTLKKECSLVLTKNLRLYNACEMLLFAEKHDDQSLKKDVQKFILEHRKEVIGLTAWKFLENSNSALAEEINRLL